MDGSSFDALLQTLTRSPSRRGIARALAGLALAGPAGAWRDVVETAAKKKRKKKKHKKRHVCAPNCAGKACGSDGCGGTCGECGENRLCQSGQCVCPNACCSNADCGFQGACESGVCDCKSGARFCAGACIPEEDCCTSAECQANQTCQDGQCVCLPAHKACDGACIPQDTCCNGSCDAGEDCLGNNSCATSCGGGDCPADCFCGIGTAEGQYHYCVVVVASCNGLPTCTSTSQCPVGQLCEQTFCDNNLVLRCVQLCPA